MYKLALSLLVLSFSFPLTSTKALETNDIELGRVDWLRDLSTAQNKSRINNKPIFILFQEIPGCNTCKTYGTNVLSHPLIVEAIETYFIPLCIHNNKGGKDQEALKYFNEPSWNNPVVRIVNSEYNAITSRLNGDYTSYGLISKINASLISLGIKLPEYLIQFETELRNQHVGCQKAIFGMYCFWSGEKTYGNLKGVVSTQAGFMAGSEVVVVDYNPSEISLDELVKIGKKNKTADKLFTNAKLDLKSEIPISKLNVFTPDKETKYYLQQTDYKYIPMTILQATRINSALADGKSCEHYLSPRQVNLHNKNKNMNPSKLQNQIGKDITKAWYGI